MDTFLSFLFYILHCSKAKELQACNFFKKETLRQLFSSEFCEISKSTFFTEHIWATASKKELILHIIICHYLYFFKNFLHAMSLSWVIYQNFLHNFSKNVFLALPIDKVWQMSYLLSFSKYQTKCYLLLKTI